MTENENWKTSGITEAQRKKLFALLSEHKIDKDIFEGTIGQKISELTKGDASECIDILINAEDKDILVDFVFRQESKQFLSLCLSDS